MVFNMVGLSLSCKMFIIGQIASKKSEHHILWCTILTFFLIFYMDGNPRWSRLQEKVQTMQGKKYEKYISNKPLNHLKRNLAGMFLIWPSAKLTLCRLEILNGSINDHWMVHYHGYKVLQIFTWIRKRPQAQDND